MSIFNKISKSFKTVGRNISHESQRRKDLAYIKESILERFDIRQLRNCCRYYKIGEPDPTKFNWGTGNTNKVRLTKAHWIKHVQRNVSLDNIKDYAKKQRINISDIVREEEDLAGERAAILSGAPVEPAEPSGPDDPFLQSVMAAINEFEPARAYSEEAHYQLELNGWLKSEFPSADIEVQTGYTRPDIVIDRVAIEIKGPTRARDLNTILDKCYRYLQNYDHLIIVLFDVNVKADRYAEWLDSIKTHFPDVPVIRKDV